MSAYAKKMSHEEPQSIPYQEYLLRVLFTSFYPAVKMGLELNYPLDTIKDMMTLALWKEAKAKHSTINLISLIFGKSTRTLKSLSARYNRGRFFEQSEMNLCRQIEDLLQQRSMSAEDLSRRLPQYNEFDGTMLAINMLLKSGRISEEIHDGKVFYVPIKRHHNLYSDDWEVRIDALSEHLEAISETLRLRFLEKSADPLAAARTFTFNANPEEIEAFREDVFNFIRQRYRELEEHTQIKGRGDLMSDHSTGEFDEDLYQTSSSTQTFSLYLGITPISTPSDKEHQR